MMHTRRRVFGPTVAVLVLALVASACGRGTADDQIEREPRTVPEELAPQSLQGEEGRNLDVIENQDEETRGAFTGGDEKTLAVDGRLWELRDGQRLMGVLQVTTTRWELDLTQEQFRQPIISQVMPAARRTVNVAGVRVYTTEAHDKVTYLWFGEAIYQVLQLKGDTLDPESVLDQILDHQLETESGQWLFVEDDGDEQEA